MVLLYCRTLQFKWPIQNSTFDIGVIYWIGWFNSEETAHNGNLIFYSFNKQGHMEEPYIATTVWLLLHMLVTSLVTQCCSMMFVAANVFVLVTVAQTACPSWSLEFGPRLWRYGIYTGFSLSSRYVSALRLLSMMISLVLPVSEMPPYTTLPPPKAFSISVQQSE